MVDTNQPAKETTPSWWPGWLRPAPPPPPPTPAPAPAPEPKNDPSVAEYIKIMWLLRQVEFKKLLPVFLTVPTLVFFAISGLIAWLGVLCGLFVSAVRGVIRLFWRK